MAKTFRDKLQESFFENKDVSIFTEEEYKHAIRLRGLFTHQLEFPHLTRTTLVKWLRSTFDIEKSQAYTDVALVESILGNVKNASKEWAKYIAHQTVLKALEFAEAKKDSKAMIKGAEVLAIIHSLNKIDAIDPDSIKMDVEFEPTDNIRVLSPKLRQSTPKDREKLRERLLANTGYNDFEFEK